MVRSYPDMSVRVIQYAPYRITFCLYFGMEIDLVPFRFYVFLINICSSVYEYSQMPP